jgi:dTDP-4-amino-4,6-dideoxygalactose transaminase
MKAKAAKNRIPLFDLTVSPAAKRLAMATLNSGWLSSGPRVREFEKTVAAYVKTRYAAAVNSGTVGLQLILRAIGAGPGREVLTTPFTFVATIEAILATGAHPAFLDIDPRTLNIDPDEVERKITQHSLAVMPVDIGGYPADYAPIGEVCLERKLGLIADAAHSFGATYKRKSIPQVTDAAVFSFNPTKNLTCGDGGMVVSRHETLIERVKLLSLHGMSAGAYDRRRKQEWSYDVTGFGLKANMSDLSAAIGLGQMTVFEKEQAAREKLAERYRANLSSLEEFFELPLTAKDIRPSWHLFIIKLHLSRLRIDRDRFISELSDHGIECGVHFRPIFELSYYRDFLQLQPQHFPNTAYAGRRVVSLPLHPRLTAAQVDYVCDRIDTVIKKHAR